MAWGSGAREEEDTKNPKAPEKGLMESLTTVLLELPVIKVMAKFFLLGCKFIINGSISVDVPSISTPWGNLLNSKNTFS